jgi:secondary thiamine-phosphate synthase enzyme
MSLPPHTTCGIVINENADPHAMEDVLGALDRMVPREYPYKHLEGNADAHVKSILAGCSVTVPFSKGLPVLGTWQGIFLMEFDGPREREGSLLPLLNNEIQSIANIYGG